MLRLAEVSTQYGKAPTRLVTGFTSKLPCAHECEFTSDWRSADVVFANVGKSTVARTSSSQVWVGTYWESLAYYPARSTNYNFTLSYSLDATFPIYHMMSDSLDPVKALTPMSYREKKRSPWASAWISNCGDRNRRLQTLKDLELVLGPAAKYGRCFRTRPRTIDDDDDKVKGASRHLFLFAAENSHCTHYHTEKVFHAFMAGVVPVYVGAPSVVRVIPPRSAILASDFPTTSALAAHVRYVADNESAYADYLAWRTRPWPASLLAMLRAAKTTYDAAWRCDVCRTLHACEGRTSELDFSCTRPMDLVPTVSCRT